MHIHLHTYIYVYLVNTVSEGCPHGVVANVQYSDIVIGEFKLQSFYYVHFWINTLGQNTNALIPLQVWVK